MNVDEVGTERFDVALELFTGGQSFTFEGVNFWLDRGYRLRVGAYTSWMSGNISDESALADIERGRRLLKTLTNQSPKFAAIVSDRVPEFYLFYDAGKSTVELARLIDGRLEWSKGTEGFRKLGGTSVEGNVKFGCNGDGMR